MEGVIQDIVNALSFGSLYALFALGIALIFGVMSLVNFAHGSLIVAGAIAVTLMNGQPFILILLVTLAAPIALALAIERLGFRSIRSAPPATLLVTSFAISFMLQNIALMAMGTVPRGANPSTFLQKQVHIGGAVVSMLSIVTVIVTLVLLAVLGLLLARTRIGIAMRAAAEDFRMARLLGVRADAIVGLAFAMSGLLAGVAALLLEAQTGTFTVDMGLFPVLIGFVAAVLGGTGSLVGAVLGGFLLGAGSVALQILLPADGKVYRNSIVFAVVLAVMVVRPQGIIVARSQARRV